MKALIKNRYFVLLLSLLPIAIINQQIIIPDLFLFSKLHQFVLIMFNTLSLILCCCAVAETKYRYILIYLFLSTYSLFLLYFFSIEYVRTQIASDNNWFYILQMMIYLTVAIIFAVEVLKEIKLSKII